MLFCLKLFLRCLLQIVRSLHFQTDLTSEDVSSCAKARESQVTTTASACTCDERRFTM